MPDRIEEKSKLPAVSLELCEYNKGNHSLKLASEYFGMPPAFTVKSHHTGRTVEFRPVSPEDPLFDQDQWDGEQQIYRPTTALPNVEYLVIYHAY